MSKQKDAKCCWRKRRYTHNCDAFAALLEMVTQGKHLNNAPDVYLGVYHCRNCNGYHLGNRQTMYTMGRGNKVRLKGIIARLICDLK